MTVSTHKHLLIALLLVAPLIVPTTTTAAETDLTISAIAKGAKFIGSSMDGARITIADAETGEVLDTGTTTGGTGNTDRIMREDHGRNRVLSTHDSARYTTTLDITETRRLKVSAFGPLSHEDDANTATVTQKVLPGKDLTGGDGIRLSIPGFVVDVVDMNLDERPDGAVTVDVTADISLMCGCPIKPDGLWDANDYRLRLKVLEDGNVRQSTPLEYTGKPTRFGQEISVNKDECETLRISAYDPETGNTGYSERGCTTK